MSLPTREFLDVACQWAFQNGTLSVDDDALLPLLKEKGIAESAILACKNALERRGAITNHRVIGGVRDFDVNRSVFLDYVKRQMPPETLCRAQVIFDRWKACPDVGPFTATLLATELGVPELHGRYLLELLQ